MLKFRIDWIHESVKNHRDCTFDSSPKYWFQLCVIFGQKNLMISPCLFACLPDKMSVTYIEMIKAIGKIVIVSNKNVAA